VVALQRATRPLSSNVRFATLLYRERKASLVTSAQCHAVFVRRIFSALVGAGTRRAALSIACVALALSGVYTNAWPHGTSVAELAREGQLRQIELRFPKREYAVTSRDAWSGEINAPGARWLHIEISGIKDNSTADYTVVILRGDLTKIASYPKSKFKRLVHLWSPLVLGGYARIVVLSPTERPPVGLTFVVSQFVYDSPGGVLESLQDKGNPKLSAISLYPTDTQLQRVARSVAKLRFVGPNFDSVCTGFMVSDSILVTNEHCVPNSQVCDSMRALFDWDPGVGDGLGAKSFGCARLVGSPDKTWDFTLVQLQGTPGDSNSQGHLTLRSQTFSAGQPLFIVQYPDISGPEEVARDGCAVKSPIASGVDDDINSDFGHTCDTKPGSSGSPVLAADNTVVGLHHWGFDTLDLRWVKENRAVQIQKIVDAVSSATNPTH